MTLVPINSIVIGSRHRKNLGNLDTLARSIADQGLLQPIGLTRDRELVFGERRLTACRDVLGWKEIEARIVDVTSIVEGEYAENELRKNFLPSERVTIAEAVAAEIGNRQGRRTDLEHGETKAERTRTAAARKAGFGNDRTFRQAKEIVEAAETEPDRFGELVQQMDRTGKVGGAYRRLRQARDESRVMSVRPVQGKHRALIVDPPWDYEWLSLAGRASPGYATMSHEELLALDVAAWADGDCHLYLWTTNNFMTRAVELMAKWGFQHKTVLTWIKPQFGMGSYFRNSTEHVLFGERGHLPTRVDDIATHFEAPTGEHSEKPETFYEIVRRASYPPYGEAFQRKNRPDFRNLFAEAEE